jgi:hypothetical protein
MAAMLAGSLLLAGCGASPPHDDSAFEPEAEPSAPAARAPGAFPASLAAFGAGYPNDGDPCRKLGESEETANWIDDSSVLVGCPGRESADALGGTVVDTVEGVLLVSIPIRKEASDLALRKAGDFDATGMVRCAIGDPRMVEECPAGVRREWGPDQTTLVEVTRPDGGKRAIFFDGRMAYGAETEESDGSRAWQFKARHVEDRNVISFGPEHYVIPDELVLGG